MPRLPPARLRGARPLGLLALLLALPGARPPAAQPATAARTVAITVDDLPLNAGPRELGCDAAALLALHERLLAGLAPAGAPAVAFVNEGRACATLHPATLETILTRWLGAGHALGNHTFSHPDLTRTTVAAYARDVVRGEALVGRLLRDRGETLRWFRHPYLRTGETAAKKDSLARFLDQRGYTVAPVTIDSEEWLFAAAYARAHAAADTATMRRLRETYLAWFDEVVAHYEGWSREVLGYEPPQVLLLHANLLNAEALPDLLALFRRRGYAFVSLETALADPAYDRPDPFVGRYGSSWLHRWAGGDGRTVRWEPSAPDWVQAYYRGEG